METPLVTLDARALETFLGSALGALNARVQALEERTIDSSTTELVDRRIADAISKAVAEAAARQTAPAILPQEAQPPSPASLLDEPPGISQLGASVGARWIDDAIEDGTLRASKLLEDKVGALENEVARQAEALRRDYLESQRELGEALRREHLESQRELREALRREHLEAQRELEDGLRREHLEAQRDLEDALREEFRSKALFGGESVRREARALNGGESATREARAFVADRAKTSEARTLDRESATSEAQTIIVDRATSEAKLLNRESATSEARSSAESTTIRNVHTNDDDASVAPASARRSSGSGSATAKVSTTAKVSALVDQSFDQSFDDVPLSSLPVDPRLDRLEERVENMVGRLEELENGPLLAAQDARRRLEGSDDIAPNLRRRAVEVAGELEEESNLRPRLLALDDALDSRGDWQASAREFLEAAEELLDSESGAAIRSAYVHVVAVAHAHVSATAEADVHRRVDDFLRLHEARQQEWREHIVKRQDSVARQVETLARSLADIAAPSEIQSSDSMRPAVDDDAASRLWWETLVATKASAADLDELAAALTQLRHDLEDARDGRGDVRAALRRGLSAKADRIEVARLFQKIEAIAAGIATPGDIAASKIPLRCLSCERPLAIDDLPPRPSTSPETSSFKGKPPSRPGGHLAPPGYVLPRGAAHFQLLRQEALVYGEIPLHERIVCAPTNGHIRDDDDDKDPIPLRPRPITAVGASYHRKNHPPPVRAFSARTRRF